MRGLNRVILIGVVGRDPDVKTFSNGGSLANISIATSESWTDKSTGERKESTEWHRLVFSNRLAEIVAQYVKKGSKIYVEGSLKTRSWDDNGIERYVTEVRVSSMQMLDSQRQDQGASNYQEYNQYGNGQPQQNNQGYSRKSNGQPQQNNQGYSRNSNAQPQQNNQGYNPASNNFQKPSQNDVGRGSQHANYENPTDLPF